MNPQKLVFKMAQIIITQTNTLGGCFFFFSIVEFRGGPYQIDYCGCKTEAEGTRAYSVACISRTNGQVSVRGGQISSM